MTAWLCCETLRWAAGLRAAALYLERLAHRMGAGLEERRRDKPAGMAAILAMLHAGGAVDAPSCDSAALASWQTAMRALSHDLRAPQSAILALAELQQGVPVPSACAHAAFVAQVAGYAQASLRLIDDTARLLRELAHGYHMEILELTALLRESADALWPHAGPAPAIELAGRKAWIRGDAAMLPAVLHVLTAQAMSAAGSTPVRVRQRLDGRLCRIAITFVPDPAAEPWQAARGGAPAMQFCRRVLLRHGGGLEADGSAGADAEADGRVTWHLHLPMLP
ncbi:HAMP domain-containing histidine kinase [Cupriavidus basilensis]|uniref:HAMP domain-containing histidine kinase n=1 Tax=Cupriavidus basilensis TaxID=68895 RepID=UPI00157AD676|nr:HAMP domain-containing histidine kinase [Cupriavidus basilensis]NUA28845.1 HAMP domain-containing histidine kinase [Cupriavidus basilensis]